MCSDNDASLAGDRDRTPDVEPDKTALRLLNLLFMLHASPTPLSTNQIIDNADAGYGSGTRDARLKKLWRDRRRLLEAGVVIQDVKPQGSSEREESLWTIDRSQTHALSGVLKREDAEAVLAAIDEHFALHADDPTRWPLQRARMKLAELAGDAVDIPPIDTPRRDNHAMRHIWSAFNRRRAAQFTYRDSKGNERERAVEIYAIFTQGRHTYLVGRCRESNRLLTFRTDRILSARKTSDSSKDYPVYRIPDDFSVEDYQFLPFDFSSNDPIQAEFSFQAELGVHELELLTRKRGYLHTAEDGTWHWHVDVRNIDEAAAMVLKHASRGMRAIAPEQLVTCVRDHICKAVSVHGA